MPLHHAGRNFHSNVVFLTRFYVELYARLCIVGAKRVSPGIDVNRKISPILHPRQLGFVALHRRSQRAPDELFVAVEVHN